MKCHGSVRLCEAMPPRPSGPWAQDGTEAHELVEYALAHKERSALNALLSSGMQWTHREDNEAERLEGVQAMLDYVYALLTNYDDAELIIERRFVFPSLVTDECGGTNDVIVFVPSLKLIYVVDYKHGAGVAVDVIENEQLMIYGVGALTIETGAITEDDMVGRLTLPEDLDDWTIVLTIVQPRAFHPDGSHPREWPVPAGRLIEFVAEVDDAITECEKPDAKLLPGTEQCRWCDAAPTCPALRDKALEQIPINFAGVSVEAPLPPLPPATDLPVNELAKLLTIAPLIETYLAAAYDHAYQLAREGNTVPGFKLVEAQSRRKWHGAEIAVAEQLMALTGNGVDDVFPRGLIGITEAEKMVVTAYKAAAPPGGARAAAKAAHDAMAVLTTKDTSGKLTLVPMTDRRQSVSLNSNFGGIAVLPPPKPPQ